MNQRFHSVQFLQSLHQPLEYSSCLTIFTEKPKKARGHESNKGRCLTASVLEGSRERRQTECHGRERALLDGQEPPDGGGGGAELSRWSLFRRGRPRSCRRPPPPFLVIPSPRCPQACQLHLIPSSLPLLSPDPTVLVLSACLAGCPSETSHLLPRGRPAGTEKPNLTLVTATEPPFAGD